MKKMILMLTVLSLMVTSVFAGLVGDPGMDTALVDINDIVASGTYYYPSEYISGMWVVSDTNKLKNIPGGNPGQCVLMRVGTWWNALGSITDNNGASTGSNWVYTVDLQNDNGGVTEFSEIKLIVHGLQDPWSSQGWANRVHTPAWTFDSVTGVELLNITIDPTIVSSSWTTFSGTVDLGAGYQFLAVMLKAYDVGDWNASLNVDNLDIFLIPEPMFLGLLGLGVLAFIRRR